MIRRGQQQNEKKKEVGRVGSLYLCHRVSARLFAKQEADVIDFLSTRYNLCPEALLPLTWSVAPGISFGGDRRGEVERSVGLRLLVGVW